MESARSQKNEKCGPDQFKWPTHTQHITEQKEVRENKEYRHSELFIQAGEQDSAAYTQHKDPDIEFRKSKARLEFRCAFHSQNQRKDKGV